MVRLNIGSKGSPPSGTFKCDQDFYERLRITYSPADTSIYKI